MLNKKAFSLIEVLIALVIFAISAFGIYGLLNQSAFVENVAMQKFYIVLDSTKFLYRYWYEPPQQTYDYVDNPDGFIDAYKIVKKPIGLFNVVRVEWYFKKGDTVVSYVTYY